MLRQATARNRAACRDGRARFAAGDGVTIPYEDDCADAAFMTHAVHFMDDPEATIVDIGRVVRSGARLVVCCHVGDDTRPTWIDPAVYSIPTRAELESMLDVAGFELVGHEHDEPSDHPTHWFVAQRAG
jgi:SAM-dependent methyltransferase